MIKGHSLAIYDLAMNVKYRMGEFENIKFSKKLNCYYAGYEDYSFKKVYIDTELSPAFRYEKWIGEVCYILELPTVSFSTYFKSRVQHFNLYLKLTVLKDNEYQTFSVGLQDYANRFPLKQGAWTELYMVEYGKEVFESYKEQIIDMFLKGEYEDWRVGIRIYNEKYEKSSLGNG